MNIGDCPYDDCDATMMLAVPENTPAYALIVCEDCKRPVWYRFSRLDPQAWTKADFEAQYEINPETKTIRPRPVEQEKP